jgi:hypothetical protein
MPPRPWWLGALNFVVLQWFGVRLARVMKRVPIAEDHVGAALERLGAITREERDHRWIRVGWKWLRWVLPLTGWRSDYVWISRRFR